MYSVAPGNRSNLRFRAWPLDVACFDGRKPTEERIRILTGGIPPIHFLFLPQCYVNSPNRTKTLCYIMEKFPDDITLTYNGYKPFHRACSVVAPRPRLEEILKQNAAANEGVTDVTGDTPLHCFVKGRVRGTMTTYYYYYETIFYLIHLDTNALCVCNADGWLPIHLAAMADLDIDIIYKMAMERPESISG